MAFPTINLKEAKVYTGTINHKGQLANQYAPFYNLVDNGIISEMTTVPDAQQTRLGFNLSHPVDIITQDSYDGSVNLVLNDGNNTPKLINSRFAVTENQTFSIPDRKGFVDTNIYDNNEFDLQSRLIQSPRKIPKLKFLGLLNQAGKLPCGVYVFYFRYKDADGNTTAFQAESGLVPCHIGNICDPFSMRLGLEREATDKAISFELSNIDATFTEVEVWYSCYVGNELGSTTEYFRIVDTYDVDANGVCNITITGSENILATNPSEIYMEYADIQSAETQTQSMNVLLMGNVKSTEHDWEAIQRLSWKITTSVLQSEDGSVGYLDTKYQDSVQSDPTKSHMYYNAHNVYYRVGYWPGEFYRFGIIYIFNDGSLSPVIQIPGVDFTQLSRTTQISLKDIYQKFKNDDGSYSYEERKWDTEDHWFSDTVNSKGAFRLPKNMAAMTYKSGQLTANPIYLQFSLKNIGCSSITTDPTSNPDKSYIEVLKEHNIKGYFFVRQIRKPTILCQGLAIQKSNKDHGNLPLLAHGNYIIAQSFLNENRYIANDGQFTVYNNASKFNTQALLVPDFYMSKPVFNDLFTTTDYYVQPISKFYLSEFDNTSYTFKSLTQLENTQGSVVKLTTVNDSVKAITNGVDYFSTMAGDMTDPTITEDLLHIWNRTLPQELSKSTTLVRGLWGCYVGTSKGNFEYGQLCNIMLKGWDNDKLQSDLMFQQLMSRDSGAYFAVSDRYDLETSKVSCFRGDCYPTMYTHRMFRNFIDNEYPTNKDILNPTSWAQNYAVRCTAYVGKDVLDNAYNNCKKENEGWFLSNSDVNLNSENGIFNQIADNFEIDVMMLGKPNEYKVRKATAKDVEEASSLLSSTDDLPFAKGDQILRYGSDPIQFFYWGTDSTWQPVSSDQEDQRPVFPTDIPYGESNSGRNWYKHTFIKHPDEIKKTGIAIADVAIALAQSSMHEWVSRSKVKINRADLNAVGLGQWITFPICSSMNLALRDIEFREATEESLMNQKRSFYPLEAMNKNSNIAESDVLNKALKHSLSTREYTALPPHVYEKQEFFTRVHYSLVDIGSTEANEWKEFLVNKYVDLDKQYGSITKIIDRGGMIYIIFEHAIGYITFTQGQNGGLDVSVLNVLNTTYGSMWKDSIIDTEFGIFGVDTVTKTIWHLAGQEVRPISDRVINKFLIDNIDLSEFVRFPYIGHVNVKSHYNANKKDVIFTYYNDIPYYIDDTWKGLGVVAVNKDGLGIDTNGEVVRDNDGQTCIPLKLELEYNVEKQDWSVLGDSNKQVSFWQKGTEWSICYNCMVQNFQTFYDWIPLESVNIDNIFFSFDKDQMSVIMSNDKQDIPTIVPNPSIKTITYNQNLNTVDSAFNQTCQLVHLEALEDTTLSIQSNKKYIGMYMRVMSGSGPIQDGDMLIKVPEVWMYVYGPNTSLTLNKGSIVDILNIKDFDSLSTDTPILKLIAEPYLDSNRKIFSLESADLRDVENRMFLWKHGQAGIYDNQGEIRPTHWYGKQHEFNFEFVAKPESGLQAIFNNLKMVANKTAPNKFEYEIVGEGYEWWSYKPIVYWINKKVEDGVFTSLQDAYIYILTNDVNTIRRVDGYFDFPETILEYKTQLTNTPYKYKKLPYLAIELADKHGRKDKSYNPDEVDNWQPIRPLQNVLPRQFDYQFNTNETVIKYDKQLNEYRIHDEQLGNDMWKYGRTRGNMQYLEDYWNIEIRPLSFQWCYMADNSLQFKKSSEARHRDKYIKIKVRYTGEDLAIIQSIHALYDQSFA